MITCCKGCMERYLGCHSYCLKYNLQLKEHIRINQELQKIRNNYYTEGQERRLKEKLIYRKRGKKVYI